MAVAVMRWDVTFEGCYDVMKAGFETIRNMMMTGYMDF